MVYRNSYAGIDPYAADLIRHTARQLVGIAGFTEHDRPDLEQEFMLDLLQRLPRFDPAKAQITTFMARIVEHHRATLLDARFAQCRDWRRCQTSLNAPVDDADDDAGELLEWLTSEGFLGSNGPETRERLAEDRRLDLERALATLPADLRQLCTRLAEDSMTDIARDTGMPRATLYDRLRRLRRAFRKCGLENYG